jgi:polyisoprenoid-binding protein YceI
MSADRPPIRTPRRLALLGGAGILAAIAVAAIAVWFVFFSSTAPDAASIDTAVGAVASGSPKAGASAGASSGAASASGVDGTWTVDTSVGSFSDFSDAWVGFRVNEVLQNIGDSTAIGRTPGVTGQLTLKGSTLQAVKVDADLTQIRSNQSRRDRPIQQALDTSSFPNATFELTAPVDLGGVPADGQTVSVNGAGNLTIHGVTKPVTVALQAKLVNGEIVVVGSTPATFTDWGISMPTAPIVVSVEDHGTIEFQLFFKRG